jgi:hypothetical protein
MKKKKHNENDVIQSLRNKKDCRISGHTIAILKNKIYDNKTGLKIINPNKSFDLGNKSWGKIDFLVKYCGYIIWQTDKF